MPAAETVMAGAVAKRASLRRPAAQATAAPGRKSRPAASRKDGVCDHQDMRVPSCRPRIPVVQVSVTKRWVDAVDLSMILDPYSGTFSGAPLAGTEGF
jgi:hypothetical protein